ncbi:TspO/MBR family protein [Phocicoccus schoeneichii]|uniref:TspO/MBR family protein n=1 Tax=Phocicoccus schoeneichii TaxID=1812261 RepID=UPI00164119D2|nr:TspO/MBR family protein [Jeotgalicoccus schoeneichii]
MSDNEKISHNSLYVSQLSLNYLWSLLYFKYKRRGTALVESFILLSTAILTTRSFYKTYPPASVILIPYVVSLSYASYLTVEVMH